MGNLSFGVNVLCVAEIDGVGHADVGQFQCGELRLSHPRPRVGVGAFLVSGRPGVEDFSVAG